MKGLGKGLDALLTSGINEAGSETGVCMISVYLIDNNIDQPRKNFDENKLRELADSIDQHGVVQPIIVKRNGERFMIIAGERRFRAARLAGLNEVPAIIREMDEQELLEVSLIENLQREDLNPMEEALAIRALMDEHELTQADVAKKLGKSRPAIANTVRLLALPDEIKQLLYENKLQAGHCRVLATIANEELLIKTALRAADEGWSVRETEQRVNLILAENTLKKKQPKRARLSSDLTQAVDSLRERLGTKVSLSGSEARGKIVIEYYSREELSSIYDRIMEQSGEAK